MGGAEGSVSTLSIFQDFYLRLVVDWVLEERYPCGWSTSSVSVHPEQVQLCSVHQNRVRRRERGKLLQSRAPRCI